MYIHIHFVNPQKRHKTRGYETSQRTIDNTITAPTHSTDNTNYNKNKCKI